MPQSVNISISQYWDHVIEVLTGKNGLSKHRVEALRQEIKNTLSYSMRMYLVNM